MELKLRHVLFSILLFLCPFKVLSNEFGDYNVGVGIADITGPVAGINMMGYANLEQSAKGLHTRLFSRAFIFQSKTVDDSDTTTENPSPPPEPQPLVVFVSADLAMVDQATKFKVVEKLKEKYPDGPFTEKNVLLSGTHTHSGPGAYLQYVLYSVTSLGFNQKSFNTIVEGMVESIEKAYANLQPGRLYLNRGKVDGASKNRSPSSYDANPEEEKNQYPDGNVDKDMVLLRIDDAFGKPLGSINWFAVHPTSMNNTNRLISGDNKGYASMLFEYEINEGVRPGKGDFVAAFASSNLGDVSPNTKGAKCIDTGDDCDYETSVCPSDTNFTKYCIAQGPGVDMTDSTRLIGLKQFEVALELFWNRTGEMMEITGSTGFIHQYVDMPNFTFEEEENRDKKVCKAALGFSFAAGTTDGPGMFNFVQGDSKPEHPFWDKVKRFLKNPSRELVECQAPKPILLAVGEFTKPYAWAPSIVETQVLQVGNLFILGFPGELTTMAGRRLRKKVEGVLPPEDEDSKLTLSSPPQVVIAGLSNVYSHYITTFEEYQKQRYEAASTLYGPHTLAAYLEQYAKLTKNLIEKTDVEAGPRPEDLLDKQWTLVPQLGQDTAPITKGFGNVLLEVPVEVERNSTVTVRFVGGHPSHSTMRGGTFFVVEKDVDGNRWKVVATDADWSTKFHWTKPKLLSTESLIEISWDVPTDAEAGYYRIRHFGYYKPSQNGLLKGYQGQSAVFRINGDGIEEKLHPEWNPDRKPPNPNKPLTIFTSKDFWHALTSVIQKIKNK